MTAAQRRANIVALLQNADAPISASLLAETFCVSRQIVVGDVALLRAANMPIAATPRGYIMQSTEPSDMHTIACKHSKSQLLPELYAIVDCGCSVIDVTVEHPVYGQMSGGLHIHSRYDADLFWQRLSESDSMPLSSLTGDAHLHTVSCPSELHYKKMLDALEERHYLLK